MLKQDRVLYYYHTFLFAASFRLINWRTLVMVTERIFKYMLLSQNAKFYRHNARNSISAGAPPQTSLQELTTLLQNPCLHFGARVMESK